uniref:Uncharacterized protein n=1 Tax=Timema cristinae TaxID=61476 RepID=A0A7R9CE41_TIMCR|nr:unnamed protein product [Timema cristinae]
MFPRIITYTQLCIFMLLLGERQESMAQRYSCSKQTQTSSKIKISSDNNAPGTWNTVLGNMKIVMERLGEAEESEDILNWEAMISLKTVRCKLLTDNLSAQVGGAFKVSATTQMPHLSPSVCATQQMPHLFPSVCANQQMPHLFPSVCTNQQMPHLSPSVCATQQMPHLSPSVCATQQMPHLFPSVCANQQMPHLSPSVCTTQQMPHLFPSVCANQQMPHLSPSVCATQQI